MSAKFAANPVYVEHEEQLLRLHRVMVADGGDSETADLIRDELDQTWWKLTRDEQERLASLSGDLYMIQDDEVFTVADGEDAPEARRRIQQALDDRNWPRLLATLRHRPADLSNVYVAFQRFRAYAGLGHWLAASDFISYCVERIVGSPAPLLSDYLNCMQRAGRTAEGLRRAAGIAPKDTSDLYWMLQFSSALQQVEAELEPEQRLALAAQAVNGFRTILNQPDLDQLLSPETLVTLYGSLALSLVASGDYAEAGEILAKAELLAGEGLYSSQFLSEVRKRIAPAGDELPQLLSSAIQEHLKLASVELAPSPRFAEMTA